MKHLLESLTEKQREVFDECVDDEFIAAYNFYEKYEKELSPIALMEVFARIKTHQTQTKIQNMLWGESERMGDIYHLRKAGNWVGCDFYQAFIMESERPYLEKYKYDKDDVETLGG